MRGSPPAEPPRAPCPEGMPPARPWCAESSEGVALRGAAPSPVTHRCPLGALKGAGSALEACAVRARLLVSSARCTLALAFCSELPKHPWDVLLGLSGHLIHGVYARGLLQVYFFFYMPAPLGVCQCTTTALWVFACDPQLGQGKEKCANILRKMYYTGSSCSNMTYSVIISFFFSQSLWIYVATPSIKFSQCTASCQSCRVYMYEKVL